MKMNFIDLPKEIITNIYVYDNTFYEEYKLCIQELNKFKNSYPSKKTKIHFNFQYNSIIKVEHEILEQNIKDYNKHILSILYKK